MSALNKKMLEVNGDQNIDIVEHSVFPSCFLMWLRIFLVAFVVVADDVVKYFWYKKVKSDLFWPALSQNKFFHDKFYYHTASSHMGLWDFYSTMATHFLLIFHGLLYRLFEAGALIPSLCWEAAMITFRAIKINLIQHS